MKKRYASLFMLLFSVITCAETEFNVSGSFNATFDEYTEVNQKDYYSTNGNGNIFGEDDWKGSTGDNVDDNSEKFQGTLDLNADLVIDDILKIHTSIETLTENFTGITNGDEITQGTEQRTVRDNDYLFLKDLTLELNTDYADYYLTNSFNYNFNPRVLAMQLEDNWGEVTPYGEGIYVKSETDIADAEVFLFQSSNKNSESDQEDYKADYIVYGTNLEKEFDYAKVGILAINTHDKISDTSGEYAGKDLDVQHYALNAEINPFDFMNLKGEYITAQYGKDVKKIDNFLSNVLDWYPESYDISGDGANKDNSIYELEADIFPIDDVKVKLGYKDVGEDYYAVLGNSLQMDSWLGDASFSAQDGTGYEKGSYGEVSYHLPFIPVDIENIISYEDFENTRSAFDGNEDTEEREIKALFKYGNPSAFSVNASYRLNTQTNSGNGSVTKTDLTFNDFNVNGNYKIYFNEKLNNTFGMVLNYYTGDDNVLDQNFSNEKKIKFNSLTEYKLNNKITFKALYRFGYATEDNDVIHNAYGMQNLIKTGFTYNFSKNGFIDVFYKYDNYKLDRSATSEELADSVYKKEIEHQWYDGAESWQHSGNWITDVTPGYDGYATHELCAKLTVKF